MLNRRQNKRLERAVAEELNYRTDIAIMRDGWKRQGIIDEDKPDPDDWQEIEVEQAPNGIDKPAVYVTLTDRVLRLLNYEGRPKDFLADYFGRKLAAELGERPRLRFIAGFLFADN